MNLRFFHSQIFEVQMQNPEGSPRGFVFDLGLGVEKPLDPLTGMSLNLVHLQEVLSRLSEEVRSRVWPSWGALLREARQFVEEKLAIHGAVCSEMRWREKRGWTLRSLPQETLFVWEEILESEGRVFKVEGEISEDGNAVANHLAGRLWVAPLVTRVQDLSSGLILGRRPELRRLRVPDLRRAVEFENWPLTVLIKRS